MAYWSRTLRELAAEARLHRYARALSRRSRSGVRVAALYFAVAVVAMLVVGTLSGYPF
ncbi:hypothetical protein [Bradyrhizobium sp.]|uniref:hypothetical protein n=1 Tax=Bradyrhizobium sp. TaxID=376 RepID=UPI003C5C83B5